MVAHIVPREPTYDFAEFLPSGFKVCYRIRVCESNTLKSPRVSGQRIGSLC